MDCTHSLRNRSPTALPPPAERERSSQEAGAIGATAAGVYSRAMGAPTYGAETLAAYFHPIRPETWENPIVGPVLWRLAVEAPAVIEAVGKVDRSLIFDALTSTPEARLARALGMAAFIERTQEAMGRTAR